MLMLMMALVSPCFARFCYCHWWKREKDTHIKACFSKKREMKKRTRHGQKTTVITYFCAEFAISSQHPFLIQCQQHANTVSMKQVSDFHLSYFSRLLYSRRTTVAKNRTLDWCKWSWTLTWTPEHGSRRERGEEKRRKSECLCLFSALCNFGAWELQQLGQALRNILSCNVNMSELWSSMALLSLPLPPPGLTQNSVQRVCQWHQEPTFSFPEQSNDPGENRLFEVLQIKLLCYEPDCSTAEECDGGFHLCFECFFLSFWQIDLALVVNLKIFTRTQAKNFSKVKAETLCEHGNT